MNSNQHAVLPEAIDKHFHNAMWQRCPVHPMRNIPGHFRHAQRDGLFRRWSRQTGRWGAVGAARHRPTFWDLFKGYLVPRPAERPTVKGDPTESAVIAALGSGCEPRPTALLSAPVTIKGLTDALVSPCFDWCARRDSNSRPTDS